jgi:hypothetical protein
MTGGKRPKRKLAGVEVRDSNVKKANLITYYEEFEFCMKKSLNKF